jgi:hypothetical protein
MVAPVESLTMMRTPFTAGLMCGGRRQAGEEAAEDEAFVARRRELLRQA